MVLFPLFVAGSALYAGIKSHQQSQRKKGFRRLLRKKSDEIFIPQDQAGLSSDLLAELLNQTDQAYQQFVQHEIDPLLTGLTRQAQLNELNCDNSSALTLNEQEQKINRRIALSGLMMGLATIGTYLSVLALIPALALGIYLMLPIYKNTVKQITQERKITLDFLMSLYLAGFLVAGYYIFFGLAATLYFTGRKVTYHMTDRSRAGVMNLFGQQPHVVWQLVEGVEVQTPVEALKVGDVVVVNAGEPLPVDGQVIEGIGSVDQHMLTGETQPVEKEIGDAVFSATLLLNGRLLIRVDKTGKDTLTGKITEILNQAMTYQTAAELKGQKLAEKTVLPNLLASLLAFPIAGLAGSIAVLGAGFGLNMRIVSLLSTMNYLTIASRHNILVKDGQALERLKDVDTIVFDKTGTLTLDQPHVAKIHVIPASVSETELLVYAATAEYRQPHPFAKAIINAANERNLELGKIEEASYEVGYGIKVRVAGKLIRVGSSRFIIQEGLTIPLSLDNQQIICQSQGFSLVFVAIDEQVVGAIELHTTIRPEAKPIIHALKNRGLSLAIISGDHLEPTQKLANELGIENYFANTLPETKATIIQRLQEEGRVVCFIGDGINDAIALKQADVSISLQGATSIATDIAQIVLMDKSLSQLDYLLALANKFDNTLRTGFMSTVVPGIICIGGVFVAGFGIYAAEILFNWGFFSGVGVAMKPLLSDERDERDERTVRR